MKFLLRVIFSVTLVSSGALADSALGRSEMTINDYEDVIELLRFVRSAKAELYNDFADVFLSVGHACASEMDEPALQATFSEVVATIQRELPKSNGSLMGKIALARLAGYYRPKFHNRDLVLENTHLFLSKLDQAFAEKDYSECARLVELASRSQFDSGAGVESDQVLAQE